MFPLIAKSVLALRRSSAARLLGAFLAMLFAVGTASAQTALPAGTVGVAYSFQVTTIPAAVAGTVYSAVGLPPGLSINVTNGLIGGTPTTAGNYSGTLSLLESGVTNNLDVTIAVDPPAGTLTITSGATATGTVGTAFNYATTTSVVAGAPATSFNFDALPPGLSGNNASGAITGTPTSAGSYSVGISANNLNGTGAVKTVAITIAPSAGAPVINSAIIASVAVGAPFTYTITATNSPTSFAASGLPLGLSLNTTSGLISGTPVVAGASTVGLTATNASGSSPVVNLALTVGALPAISSAAVANASVGLPFSFGLTATNSPTSFSVAGLPPGLSANTTTGAITGSATTAGVYPVTVSASNATGTGATATLTITAGNVPTITSAATASGTVGSPFSFTLTANNGATSFAVSGLPAGLSATLAGTISGSPLTAGSYGVSVSGINAFGTGPASTLTLAIAALPVTPPPPSGNTAVAPSISVQPIARSVSAGGSVTFTVVAAGSPPITYQWRKDGVGISGATSSSLTLANVTVQDAGGYGVVVANANGFAQSNTVVLTVVPVVIVTAPSIAVQPLDQSVLPGVGVTFSVSASGTGTLTYQWRRNGVALAGATGATLTVTNVQADAAGSYDVVITNSAGSVTSRTASLSVQSSRIMNVSVRSGAGTGDQTLIVGFRIEGTGTKFVLLRGVGPTLAQLNVLGALADPQLKLFNGAGVQTNENDDWGGSPAFAAAFAQVGAFALPAASKDAALLVALPAGPATAHITSTSGTGVALVEAYDVDPGSPTTRLVNISARTQVGTGENILIAGFVIDGTAPKTVLIRGVGPGLIPLGLSASSVLADPQLRLFNGAGQLLQENDDWGGGASLGSAFTRVGAFALPAGSSKDAAMLVTLPPGGYTAQVSGVGNTTGVVLVEVYEVP